MEAAQLDSRFPEVKIVAAIYSHGLQVQYTRSHHVFYLHQQTLTVPYVSFHCLNLASNLQSQYCQSGGYPIHYQRFYQ